jgi:outer membrane protein assembly factor BamB
MSQRHLSSGPGVPRLLLLGALAGILVGCGGPPEDFSVDRDSQGSFPGEGEWPGWPQWGGPNRNFQVEVEGLAESWPVDGPPLIWSRELGEGYSAIVAAGGALFTMFRDGDADVVVALRTDDGSVIWEHSYDAPTSEESQTQFGEGPNATPLVVGDRLITLGYTGVLNALDLTTGEVLWSRHLIDDLDGQVLDFGYSASPVLHEGKVLVLVGGETQAVVALDPEDGSVVWASGPGSVSYATPLVIDVDGQQQLVYHSADEVIGLDVANGERLWDRPCVNQYRNNATGVLWGKDNVLLVATQLDGGTRAYRLKQSDGVTEVEELWSSNQISIHFWNTLRLGDVVYASVGGQASTFAAVDVASGDILWRQRGFTQANLVHAGERTILLDADGELALLELTPEAGTVISQAKIANDTTWTAPTLIGTRLYVRDKKSIRALELGPTPDA